MHASQPHYLREVAAGDPDLEVTVKARFGRLSTPIRPPRSDLPRSWQNRLMATYLDLDSWPRRPHFDFFRSYSAPFWDVCAKVDVTFLASLCRESGRPSFSLATIYLSLRAANAVENFRYRLRGERVLVHPLIHGSSTVLRPDETFGFSYFDFLPDYRDFEAAARREVAAVAAGQGLLDAGRHTSAASVAEPGPDGQRDDLIYYSVLPWIHFTSFQHARRDDPQDSVPRLTFGKYAAEGDRLLMPVSLSLHHALADGLHAGRFFEKFQWELDALAGLG